MGRYLDSVALGILGGVIAWALAHALFRPRIRCSLQIIKSPAPSFRCGSSYRVKVKNVSFTRSLVDLKIVARVYMVHRPDREASVGRSLRLATSPADLFILRARDHIGLTVDPGGMSDSAVDRLREWGYCDVALPGRSLEDLLALPDAYFSLMLQSTDSWSGITRFTETPRIRLTDDPITQNPFVRRRARTDRSVIVVRKFVRKARARLARAWWVARSNPELCIDTQLKALPDGVSVETGSAEPDS